MTSSATSSAVWSSCCAELLTALGVDAKSGAPPLRLQLIAAGNAPEKGDALASLGRALQQCVGSGCDPSSVEMRLCQIYAEQPGLFGARARSRSPPAQRATPPALALSASSTATAPSLPPQDDDDDDGDAAFANAWEFRPRSGRTYIGPAQGKRPTTMLALQATNDEWIRVSFAPKWGEETIGKGFAKLKFQVYAEDAMRRLRAFDAWAKGQMAVVSREMFGKMMSVEDIEREEVYRSSLWVGRDPNYPPSCEVGLVTRGPEAFMTRFSFEKSSTGEIEHATTSAAEALLGLHRECPDARSWTDLRFRVVLRPESVYTFTNREGTKIAGINLVAVSLVVRRPEATGDDANRQSQPVVPPPVTATKRQTTLSFPQAA